VPVFCLHIVGLFCCVISVVAVVAVVVLVHTLIYVYTLLQLQQLQAHGQQWASVYELAQQAFALSQAVSGPLHRATAIALEFVAKALFYLGDPEVLPY
jgi:hypothetical protein